MRKKDRTSDEKRFDDKIKTAIMRIGPNPQPHEQPTPYPYVLVWDRLGRKGQRVAIIRQSTKTAQIKFEVDGFTTVINRQALRRV
jgi:hypothetical protein